MEEGKRDGRRVSRRVGWSFWLSVTTLLIVAGLYLWQPDGAYALTIYSPWVPAILGLSTTMLTAILRKSKALLAVGAAWAVWGLGASEEIHSLCRGAVGYSKQKPFKSFRVVSLNCAGGSILAAREVKAWKPDVVLLQESPSKMELALLATELYGESSFVVVGPDASILSRFRLQSFKEGGRETANYVGAFAKISSTGETWLIVSLRLQPPVLRFDYWNPACWIAYSNGKKLRRKELEELWNEVLTYDDDELMIVGGDFNAPPDRSIREIARKRISEGSWMVDAVRVAGRGWTHSAVNDYPLVRIDQIWLDSRIRSLRTIAVKTVHSDHRMVVCDFALDR